MSFSDLGLSPELLRAVAHEGYTEPTPVQAEAIPLVLDGRDLLAGAQTGTGKTAAFVLPMVQRLHASRPEGRRVIRALILAPTRELALQVEESVRTYSHEQPIKSVAIYGGVGFDPQVRALRNGPEIVVATPGRLLDHAGQRTIDLSHVEILVLDEADRMLDMGFIRDIRKIIDLLPPRRQNLMFSATFSNDIRQLANGILHEPASVQVTPRNTASELVEQSVILVDRDRKRELLSHLVKSGVIYQALVFTRTKHGANKLAQQLELDGIPATAIHGNKSQPQRVRALADFKANRFAILVATEVAARGLDIDSLPHVVNYELPMVPEDYVHRIGRTGRAGADGSAVSLVCVDESRMLREIEGVLGHPIPRQAVEGFEPDLSIRPEPILRGGLGGARPGQGQRRPSAGAPRYGSPRPQHGQRPVAAPRPVGAPRHDGPRPVAPASNGGPAFFQGARPSNVAPRPNGGGRPNGSPRPNHSSHPSWEPRPDGAPHRDAAPRHDGAPRHAGAPRSNGGNGHGRPSNPGQWLGQRPSGDQRPSQGHGQRHGAKPHRGQPNRPGQSPRPADGQRSAAMPGERFNRQPGRSQG
jgi:ATP-dependent RNA helicase RhlE